MIILTVLLWLRKKREFNGRLFLWYLILEANASLFVERYRGEFRGQVFGGDMSPGQFLAIVVLVCSAITLLIKSRKRASS